VKICLNDTEILLNDAEANYSREVARQIIDSIIKQVDERNAVSTGMSVILQLHLLTGDMLKAIEPEAIKDIFKSSKIKNITTEDLKQIAVENQQQE